MVGQLPELGLQSAIILPTAVYPHIPQYDNRNISIQLIPVSGCGACMESRDSSDSVLFPLQHFYILLGLIGKKGIDYIGNIFPYSLLTTSKVWGS